MAKKVELALKVGDVAPEFAVPQTDGSVIRLSQLRGKHVILYFYPKDDTPGCTKEACAFRDAYAQFQKKGALIFGASTDPLKAHVKFTDKFTLPFPLLSDEKKELVEAYGVWGEKSFMGRKYMGTHRVTFHIGPDGTIAHIWPEVKPEEHAAEVLAVL
jgi:peroxiredoxin Q/BCP